MRAREQRLFLVLLLMTLVRTGPVRAADRHGAARERLIQLLLGKEVQALVDLPATKEGTDIYFVPPERKRIDERGIDLEDLTKWLKEKGVGIEAHEWELITNVQIGKDKIEVHIGGGGQGRRGSKHANKVSPTVKRAGGSRINFRYQADLNETDLAPENFLRFMERVLDVSRIRFELTKKELPPEIRTAIDARTVKEGMNYQLVLMTFGDPEQKKINDSVDGKFSETWFYLKDGRRWVLEFLNGKVAKVSVY
ncbi:MAG: hypothetical protein AB1898_25390 [Acidobacteriota bacterium]